MLSHAGVASRRAAEEMITSGRVEVDGRVVTTLGVRVDPDTAKIVVDGRRISIDVEREYWALNKPAGVVTTMRDPQGRPTVAKLVRTDSRVYPVGRLDADTMGLILLTSHGELAHRLAHPRFGVRKVYLAEVAGQIGDEAVARLVEGLKLDDGWARAAEVTVKARSTGRSQVEVVMTEGRKREVRRLLEAVGSPVTRLVRTAFGPVSLGRLASGEARRLTAAEVGSLLAAVDL